MKRNRLLLILLFFIVGVVAVAAAYQKLYKVTPEEILDEIKKVNAYTVEVTYVIKNARGEIKEQSIQFYDKTIGTRVDFGQDRILIYKDNKIFIKDLKSNNTYEVDNNFDQFYKLAFLNEVGKYILNDEEFKYHYSDIEGKRFLILEFSTLSSNENLYKEVFIIDIEKKSPREMIIYDKRGNERGRITYNNYKKADKLDKKLFEM